MFNFDYLISALNGLAPLSLSQAMIDAGEYDNSGVLVKCHDEASAILFALDLTDTAVNRAVRNKCDVIVTHHPAIYAPIKGLSVSDGVTSPVLNAIRKNINVVSMHLNLDIADGGIDASLSEGLGGDNYRILEMVTELNGYGREFSIKPTLLKDFVKKTRKNFSTNKLTVYGKRTAVIKKVASFCGAGGSSAEKCVLSGLTDADLIISSDMPHHIIKELVEKGKNIILLPHYVAEEYGFKKFYIRATERINGKAQTYYFDDKRFR